MLTDDCVLTSFESTFAAGWKRSFTSRHTTRCSTRIRPDSSRMWPHLVSGNESLINITTVVL